ncbi:hypothetical protein R1flu_023149 [Riccia fluitans]|uniref:Uncharacterized protein n=1 Tax=Riccia fluitans TaxID=41844 RepID=A0ABD1XRC9_9MARC
MQEDSKLKSKTLYNLAKVTPEQDRTVGPCPKDKEIDRTAKMMKMDKSPGQYGLTTEMLLACWSFVRTDCLCTVFG